MGHSEKDKFKLRVEDEEVEAMVKRRLEKLTDTVTLQILSRYSRHDEVAKQIFGC